MAKFDVISPDGFSIERDKTYTSKKQAQDALNRWMRRYESQGHYSSNNGRIPLNELESKCIIKPINESQIPDNIRNS